MHSRMLHDESTIQMTKIQLKQAINYGLGRVVQYVQTYGVDDVIDALSTVCLDTDCYEYDGVKFGRWLYALFAGTEHEDKIKQALVVRINDPNHISDLELPFGVLKAMEQNDATIAERYRQRVLEIVEMKHSYAASYLTNWVGVYDDRIVDSARILGRILNPNDDQREAVIYWHLPKESEEQIVHVHHLLNINAQHDSDIARYVDYLMRHDHYPLPSEKTETPHKRPRRKYEKDSKKIIGIIEAAKNHKQKFPTRYAHIGRWATVEARIYLLDTILSMDDLDAIYRLLWVFRTPKATTPYFDEKLIDWANSSHEELRASAVRALCHLSHEQIYQLAINKLETGQITGRDSGVMRLFSQNYRPGDGGHILSALERVSADENDIHNWFFDLIDAARINKDEALIPVLKWGYSKTPCWNCRHAIVKQLIEWNALDDDLATECQFDADPDIRELVKKVANPPQN